MKNLPVTTKKADLLKAWSASLRALDVYAAAIEKIGVNDVLLCVTSQIQENITRESRLSRYDEKIYEYYKNLMRYYYDTLNIYEETRYRITDPSVLEILDGIKDILASQLKQFEERQGQRFVTIDRTQDNPIRSEKEKISLENKQHISKAIRDTRIKLTKECNMKCRDTMRKQCAVGFAAPDSLECYSEMLSTIYNYFEIKAALRLYKNYVSIVKECVGKINSLQLRRETHFYYEAIQEERENLGIIIKVQVVALERAMQKRTGLPEEEATVQIILGKLRECYQYTGKEIMELVASFKEAESKGKTITTMSEPEFRECISSYNTASLAEESKKISDSIMHYATEFASAQRAFDEILAGLVKESVVSQVKEFFMAKNVYVLKKALIEKIMMTDEIITEFKEIVRYYEENNAGACYSHKNAAEVIKGINETMEIKIESLNEAKELFFQQGSRIMKDMDQDGFEIGEAELEDAANAMRETWYSVMLNGNISYDDRYINILASQVLAKVSGLDVIVSSKEKVVASKEKSQGVLDKAIMQYLRDQLLFEISTFEEITNYSVIRLRDSDEPAIQEYVKKIDSITSEISSTLKKYNIATIKPEIGDMFSGKEHDCIMAEKLEGYQKGQIIKIMGSGYRYGEQVLIRANVIAAN